MMLTVGKMVDLGKMGNGLLKNMDCIWMFNV